MSKDLNVAMIGYKFMGKAHSNAWYNVGRFFSLPRNVVMKAVCGRDAQAVRAFAREWGWQEAVTDWRRLVARDDIDVVDVATPNNTHAAIAIAALEAGKAVICEKPLAMNRREAGRMRDVAKRKRCANMVWHNYRRAPAVAQIRRMIANGDLGRIYHFRAVYLQDWLNDPRFPLAWRMQKGVAGSGAHGDLAAHSIDLCRFTTGLEIAEVVGAMETFIRERPLAAAGAGRVGKGGSKKGRVTVDDAVAFIARLSNGALATFEATRFAPGRKNYNRFEINAEKGSLVWNFEEMNEFEYYSEADRGDRRGFRKVIATEPCHPYLEAWWPPAHIIGYEHTFVNQAADFVRGLAKPATLKPDFEDGYRTQVVLDAVAESVAKRRWVKTGLR